MCEWIRCNDRVPEQGQEILAYWGNLKSGRPVVKRKDDTE